MKKIYLIKKDPAKEGQDNWIIMNGFEFARFRETEEGTVRSENVARVPFENPGDTPLYMEVDEKTAKEWKSKNNGDYYKNKVKEELGISIVSYHGIQTDDEEMTGEDMLVDTECDVEGDVILKIQKEELSRAIEKLSKKERLLIEAMYLSDEPMTEEDYSLVLGTSRQYVHKLKHQTLSKLKLLLES